MFLSAVSRGSPCVLPGSSLVLDPTGRLGGLRSKVGSACEEFEYDEGDIR